MKQQAPVTEYLRYFCTFLSSYHPQIRPILQRWGRTPQGYIQLLSRIAFLESQQSCSLKTSDKQALIHQGWWDFVHILSTGHELEYLPDLIWKSVGVFQSLLALRPICSLKWLSDQPSIPYQHRLHHLWSLLLSLKEEYHGRVIFMSSDKCFQKKSIGYSAEVPTPYTINLSFYLVWDYCSLSRSCSPASSSFLTRWNEEADTPLKILHLYQSFSFFMRNLFYLLGKCKEAFQKDTEHTVMFLCLILTHKGSST